MLGRSCRVAVSMAVALILSAVACGSEDDGGVIAGATTSAPADSTTTSAGDSTTTTTSGGDAVAAIELTVERVDSGVTATLACAAGGGATGTGWLADPAAAAAACELLGDQNARRLLTEPPDPGRMCTQIFGGPEQAVVSGTIDGEQFTARFARNDGCGIADWDELVPLLGAPGS